MVGTAVLVVEIVGVFPDVEGEEGLQTALEWVGGVGLLGDDEVTVGGGGEPYPAGAEEGGAFLLELGLEVGEGAEVAGDGGSELAHGLVLGFGCAELGEVEVVVQDLSGVVEYGAVGLHYDFFERQRCPLGFGQEGIEVIDVAGKVLAVVEGEGLTADDGLQGFGGVG